MIQVAERAGMATVRAGEPDRVAWDAYVAGHDQATGYHEWAWRGVFERSFGHEVMYLMAKSGEQVAGVLPLVDMRSLLFGHFVSSLPFVNYGGVLADSEGAADVLIRSACALASERGARHVELRHVDRRFVEMPCRRHKVTMRLALAPGMWERFDRKVRNQIRKAEKSGLSVEHGDAALLADFYTVFARNMRDLGTPVYGREFFAEVLRTFPTRARVVLVRSKGAPVAGGIMYRTGSMVEVPWASSLRELNSLCPNHLLYWHVIESALAEGCDTLDFGRSTPNEGTYKFKAQWGAEPVPLHWEYPYLRNGQLPDQGPTNPKFQAAIAIWKRTPLWFANSIGPFVVRGIP